MRVLIVYLILGLTPLSAADYLAIVRSFADTMISDGRDRYGAVRSPLFAAALDRHRLALLDEIPQELVGIRDGDRSLTGANPMHDQNFYQVLYALSDITGEAHYGEAADSALGWFFDNCQSPATGLMAWGEHLSWNFRTEQVESPRADQDYHELYRPWVLMGRTFGSNSRPMIKLSRGLWEHQIHDQETGAFSRHASYSRHGPMKGMDFPRHAGFYIDFWMAAYEASQDPEYLVAVERIVDRMEGRRNAKTGALPSATDRPDHLTPRSTLSLAIDLWRNADKAPAALAEKMRRCARKTDEVFLRLKQDLGPYGKGFFKAAFASTLEPGDFRMIGAKDPKASWYPYSRTWVTGYGMATDAEIAMLCLLRYEQVKVEGYKTLAIAAADRYMRREPNRSEILYPGAFAESIGLLRRVHELTGEERYLERADELGETAVDLFFQGSSLPRASSKHDHYEAITRADSLAMELLELWSAREDPKVKPQFTWSDR